MNLIEKKKYTKLKKILLSMVCLIPLFLITAFATETAGGIDLSGVNNAGNSFITTAQVLGGIILGVVFAIAFIASLGGGRQGREWAKPTMLWSSMGFLGLMNVDEIVKFIDNLSKMI